MALKWENIFSEAAVKQKASPIREMMSAIKKPGMISFAGGMPDPDIFPLEKFAESASIIHNAGKDILQYGATDGYPPLKEFISEWTAPRMGRKTAMEEILITSGSIQVADLLTLSTLNPGDHIITESPTFLGTILDMHNHGADLSGIPCDSEGMKVDMIPPEIERIRASGGDVKYIYTIPNFQNPVGCTMTLERRKRLLEIAHKYNVPILEDDPYGYIRFEGEDFPTLFALDEHSSVIFAGSFSKILAPGVRVGWCIGPPEIIRKMTVFKQGIDTSTSIVAQGLIYEYCRKGYLESMLPGIIDHYRKKRDVMEESFRKFLPVGKVNYTTPSGGFFYWLNTPDITTDKLFDKAIERKVAFVKGHPFFPNEGGENEFRMCYSFASIDEIEEGVKRLAEAMNELL